MKPVRVCFVFATGGIGGAERSMARLMVAAHPHTLDCRLALVGRDNPDFVGLIEPASVPWRRVSGHRPCELRRLLAEWRPDVAYLFGQIRTLWWTWSARGAGVTAIIGAERGSGTRWINILGRRLDRRLLDAYIANSARTAEVLNKRACIPAERIHVVHNGLTFDDSPIPPLDPPLPPGGPRIACVANIRPVKGQVLLLRAVKRLREHYPQARAILIGHDMTDGAFFKQAESEDLADTYTWVGFVPDVRPALASSDIFVLPSPQREGLPTSILEAMRAGLPVIGTRVGGVDELVLDGRTGLVVQPGSVEALLAAMKTLLDSRELRDRFSRAGRQRVDLEFTIQRMVDKHVDVFTRVLAARK